MWRCSDKIQTHHYTQSNLLKSYPCTFCGVYVNSTSQRIAYSSKAFVHVHTPFLLLLLFRSPSRPALLKGLYAMGFNRPSKIQERALPLLLADPPQNFIAQSQSGTGKTAAFVLAMLSRVDPTKAHPQVTWRGLHY